MGLGGSGGYRPARRGLSGIEYCIFQAGIKLKYLFASENFLLDFNQTKDDSYKKGKKVAKILNMGLTENLYNFAESIFRENLNDFTGNLCEKEISWFARTKGYFRFDLICWSFIHLNQPI
jgi:hypothetical protein